MEICEPLRVLGFALFQILKHAFEVVIELGGVGIARTADLFDDWVFQVHISVPISSSGVHKAGIS